MIRSLHFMMLGHDLEKSPGRYRQSAIYVHDEEVNEVVYEGPESDFLQELMGELVVELQHPGGCPSFVRGAMAHLNLVMIHPFRDGNGRMARALQTLVLARERNIAPEFSSIEEWLGKNTAAYYAVLAEVGQGSWQPANDTQPWIRFNLIAHHMQAQTVLRRVTEAAEMWSELDTVISRHGLPERTGYALYDAMIGLRVRRSRYAREAEIEQGAATRDLRLLVSLGLLEAIGETRGRLYVASPRLRSLRNEVARSRQPLLNPYTQNPESRQELRKRVSTFGQRHAD
ncbi:Fic family protein [Actinokineospora sp.]|uniref:Fic family protein n=1 Tax=Actinokineospora sp. TaxID=1872133 RepID=UPI003D6A8D40